MDETEPCNIADSNNPCPQPHLSELYEVVLSYSEYILEHPDPFT